MRRVGFGNTHPVLTAETNSMRDKLLDVLIVMGWIALIVGVVVVVHRITSDCPPDPTAEDNDYE